MKNPLNVRGLRWFRVEILLPILLLVVAWKATAGGTWTALAHAPPSGLNNALLLSDGTVICGDGGEGWYRLTPDVHGSYVNGTWSQIASTSYGRLFYSSDVLTNGNVYVAGGEYGSGRNVAELYDTLANTWTVISQPVGAGYGDADSKLLPNGNVLQGNTGANIYIYNTASNILTDNGTARGGQDEACWVRLPNNNILTIDPFGQNSEHYVPSLNAWFVDGTVPVALYGYGGELGPGIVLPNGKAFYIGATTNTAIYTPGATLSSAGTWTAGPTMVVGTNLLGAVDAPAAMMVNGKILCALGGISGFGGPVFYLEYDYVSNSFTQVSAPNGTDNNSPFATSMLDLPDGNVLLIDGQGTTSLYVYQPDGTPLAAGQPVISNITENADGSYHLTGVGFNGITGGAAYGDDWQMDSNYPLVRMTNNSSGNVYYARTFKWSSTTIQNTNPVSTEFSLPVSLPSGTYSLVVSANGNASAPVSFTYTPIAAPTGLTATAGVAQVSLTWRSVSGATAYNVKRALNSGGPYYAPVTTLTGTNFTDTGLTDGLPYYYVVTAVGSGGPSAYSAEASATPVGPPPVPSGLAASADTPTLVNLSWNAIFGAASYNVKRATVDGGPYATIGSPAGTNFNDTNVTAGTTYYYVVSAVGLNGESANSAQVSVSALPTPWVTLDIGAVGAVGNAGYSNGTFLADGSGSDIWSTNDTFRFVYQALSGNCDIRARVVSVQNTDASSKAGVMIRETLNTNATHCLVNVKGGGGLEFLYRTTTGAATSSGSASGNAPQWVRLTRTNTTFTGYYSANGSTWTQIGTTTISMATTFYVGLAVCAHNNNGVLCAGVFDNVSVSGGAPAVPTAPISVSANGDNGQVNLTWAASTGATVYNVKRSTVSGGPYTLVGSPAIQQTSTNFSDIGLAGATTYYYVVTAANNGGESSNSTEVSVTTLPSPWVTSDVGSVGAVGSASNSAGVFTIKGSGADIWGNSDEFRYVYQAINGNCDIRARVASLQNTDPSCKAGVMIRASLEDASSRALVNVKGGGGLESMWRLHDDASSSEAAASGSAPQWVRLARTNNTLTGYYSVNGTSWIQMSSQTLSMGPIVYVGLAVCSHNDGVLCTATFDNVTINSTVAPATPGGLAAIGTNAQVRLSWNTSLGATSYNVKRSTNSGGPYTIISSPITNNYADAGVVNGTTYYYVVSAVNVGGASADSSQAGATPMAPPAAPTGLSALAGNMQVSLSWNVSSNAAAYNLKRSTTSGSGYASIVSLAGTNYVDMGLSNGVTYYYVVSATNVGGEGPISSEVSATPSAPAPVPVVLMVGPSTNGYFSLSFSGQTNQSYVIETSTNLSDWLPVLTNTPTNGVFMFTDTNATDAQRFYRAKE